MSQPPSQPEAVTPGGAAGWRTRWKVLSVCLLLTAAVWLVFGQTLRFGFVNIDDGIYVYQNRLITAGVTRVGLRWFLTHAYCDYWGPILALSQMIDCQLYGLWAGGHHLNNVLLFNADAVLLFAVFYRMTGALWRSAFVAAAWAVHPLRAESVAWIAERKDVLSGLFFVLTLAAYARYARGRRSWTRRVAVLVFFALGLMCKPNLVTLPFVLLLLDYWPLDRVRAPGFAPWKPLLAEKIPLFLLSAAASIVTVVSASHTLVPLQQTSFAARAGDAILSSVVYLQETVYPAGLAAFYPYSSHGSAGWEVAAALALLGGITAATLICRRTQPWLVVGWLWYLIMLAPTSGLLQSGEQAHADRFTYLPQIGLLLAISWTAANWCATRRDRQVLSAAVAAGALSVLAFCARRQVSLWRDSATLWRHTLACTSDNSFAQNNLGVALLDQGRPDEAAAHFRTAVEIRPRNAQAQYNLGNSLRQEGRPAEAIECYRRALAVSPDDFDALNNLGIALAAQGRVEAALASYRSALALRPGAAEVHVNFGHALLQAGRAAEAVGQFKKAVELAPGEANGYDGLGGAQMLASRPADAARSYRQALKMKPADEVARSGLGSACFVQGRVAEAIENWRAALTLQPDKVTTLNNLGWVLATGPAAVRNGAEAVRQAERAARLTGGKNPVILRTLAAAYTEAGRFSEARTTAAAALNLEGAPSKQIER